MESPRFSRKKEDFTCANCGMEVKGTGYTDHCPRCLYSMHVDVQPGDRKERCGGLMRPVGASSDRQGFTIHYVCTKCRKRRSFKAASGDNMELIYGLMAGQAPHGADR